MADVHASVDLVFRRRAGDLTATLTRAFGLDRLDLVEDAVQDAFVQALRTWPWSGIPEDPGAWLYRVARNRALDVVRRRGRWRERRDAAARSVHPDPGGTAGTGACFSAEVADDRLGMIFACCHPSLGRDAQVALTLKVVCGFGVEEIARAFLVRRTTMAQRIVRAKRALRDGRVELAIPSGDALAEHRDAVLEVLYLMFNEGYAASRGDDLVRTELCAEAVSLAESLAAHEVAGGPRADALAALLLFQAARLPARVDADGELVRLDRQDRARWDRCLLGRAVEHLRRSARGDRVSAYHLQAEIASCHSLAETWEATDWPRILACYDALLAIDASPVVALNRVVAVAEVEGTGAAWRALASVRDAPILATYEPRLALEGELLERTGRSAEAIEAYRRAAELSRSEPVRRYLERRARALERAPVTGGRS